MKDRNKFQPYQLIIKTIRNICRFILKMFIIPKLIIMQFMIVLNNFCVFGYVIWQFLIKILNKKQDIIRSSPNRQPTQQQIIINSPYAKQKVIEDIWNTASSTPQKKTLNTKIILIKDRMKSLEQMLFFESKRKCKIQKQIFETNIQLVTKNYQFSNLSQKIYHQNKELRELKRQISIVQDKLYHFSQKLSMIDQQIKKLKQRARSKIKNQKRKI